jgi:hypothetical protein
MHGKSILVLLMLALAALVAVPEADACGGNASGRQGLLARLRATTFAHGIDRDVRDGVDVLGGGRVVVRECVPGRQYPPAAPMVIVPPQVPPSRR